MIVFASFILLFSLPVTLFRKRKQAILQADSPAHQFSLGCSSTRIHFYIIYSSWPRKIYTQSPTTSIVYIKLILLNNSFSKLHFENHIFTYSSETNHLAFVIISNWFNQFDAEQNAHNTASLPTGPLCIHSGRPAAGAETRLIRSERLYTSDDARANTANFLRLPQESWRKTERPAAAAARVAVKLKLL